jgi:hypothetical protein
MAEQVYEVADALTDNWLYPDSAKAKLLLRNKKGQTNADFRDMGRT